MWRLLNKLFGWHYVVVYTDMHERIARARWSANNRLYIDWSNGIWFLNEDGKTENGRWNWEPLTWTNE